MQPQSLSRCVTSFMCHVHSELSIGVTSGHVSWFMHMCHAFTSVTSSLPQPTFIYVTSFVYWMEYWSHFRIRLVAHICVNYPCVTSPPSPIPVCHIIHGVLMRHVTLICDVLWLVDAVLRSWQSMPHSSPTCVTSCMSQPSFVRVRASICVTWLVDAVLECVASFP